MEIKEYIKASIETFKDLMTDGSEILLDIGSDDGTNVSLDSKNRIKFVVTK